MRAIWNGVAIFAFLNLVLLLLGGGWILNSGRYSAERVREVTSIFEIPVEEEEASTADEVVEDGEAALPSRPPLTAEDQLKLRVLESEADRQRIQRLEREVKDLKGALQRERVLLDRERTTLETDRGQFEQMRREIAETEGAEQFRKALVVLEKMPPKSAKDALLALIQDGRRDEAVGYLNAMADRSRVGIVEQLVKNQDAPLAADLLEELRTRGVGDLPVQVASE